MQLKTKSTAYTEPKHRPHPEKIKAGPREKNEENDKDAEPEIEADDFDLPEKEVEDENLDDEIDAVEEADRPG